MKQLLAVFGAFFFTVFIEAFTRIIIVFYNQETLIFYGLDSIPGPIWVISLYMAVFTGTWLAGMVLTTAIQSRTFVLLSLLFTLQVMWRVSEFSQLSLNDWPYSLTIILTECFSLITVFLIQRKNASNN
ncbi:MAG TPA: hypothetical protein DEQ34_04490 [Balneolaceae bacterium]|nr:hypothetical protein [Balneolaceae bacterium]|tara:strand:+ start:201790 stop:202176 length:387 start_codon:yes stop_codon:yes gene_type:complete